MKPPVIPPDRAFAVDGVVDRRVRAALAEARRIRDGWADAVAQAEADAAASAGSALRAQLEALFEYRARRAEEMHAEARTQALKLATRLVGAHFAASPAAVDAQLAAITSARADWLEIRVPPGTPVDGAHLDGLSVRVDPALRPGELILVGPNGTVDARFGARLARLEAE